MPKADPTKLLRGQHLEKAFGVTSMTLFLWRGGTPTKTALPTVDTGSRLVAYNPKQVEAWAKKNGVALLVSDLTALLAGGTVIAAKPGPKVKLTVQKIKQAEQELAALSVSKVKPAGIKVPTEKAPGKLKTAANVRLAGEFAANATTAAAAVMKNAKRIPKLPSAAKVSAAMAAITTKAARASPKRVAAAAP